MISADYKRTSVYSGAEKAEPKFMFVWLCEQLEALGIRPERLLDVGCAAGDFLQYAQNRYPGARCEGVEYDAELVELARQRDGHCVVHQGDANRMSALPDNAFDAVFLTGVHSIFDDFRPSFSECVRVAKNGGVVLITGLFNDYPLDARIQWRYAEQFEAPWHPGYNLFSKQSVGAFLNELVSVKRYSFEKFSLPFDLQPQTDPVRSWTETGADGQRTLRNGIMPLPLELLMIQVEKKEDALDE